MQSGWRVKLQVSYEVKKKKGGVFEMQVKQEQSDHMEWKYGE